MRQFECYANPMRTSVWRFLKEFTVGNNAASVTTGANKGHPKGLYLLFVTEMAERFSYYGMRAIFVLYLVAAFFSSEVSSQIYGSYTGLVYLTPLLGGYIADRYWGNRRSIIAGGLIMALGQFFMFLSACFVKQSITSVNGAIDPSVDNGLATMLMFCGLGALILGNGFFKPNISTMVGDLYEPTDSRKDAAFTIFYMGINVGAFIAPFVCGTLGEGSWNNLEPFKWGFLAACIAMILSVTVFWALKDKYLVTPDGLGIGLPPAKSELRKRKEHLEEEVAAEPALADAAEGDTSALSEAENALAKDDAADDAKNDAADDAKNDAADDATDAKNDTKADDAKNDTKADDETDEERTERLKAEAEAALEAEAVAKARARKNSPIRIVACIGGALFMFLFFSPLWDMLGALFGGSDVSAVDMDINSFISAAIYALAIALPTFIITDRTLTRTEKGRIGVIYIIALFVIFFWSAFEQAGSSLTIFADKQVDRMIGDFEFKTSWFQSINPIVVVSFAPIMALLWQFLGKRKKEPASVVKQAIGLLLLAIGYLVISFATKGVEPGVKVSMFWLVTLYFIHTIGELSLSPIGLSMVNKLAPAHLASLLMGVWFMSNAASNILAGKLATLLPDTTAENPVAKSFMGIEIASLDEFFLLFAVMAGVASLLLFAL